MKLGESQRGVRNLAYQVAEEKLAPGAAQREEKGDYPWDMVSVMKEHRFFAVPIPEEYGGLGGKMVDTCLVMEEIARVCNNCAAIFSFSVLAPYPVLLGGSETQKEKYLPKFASGELLGAYAAALKTRAVVQGDDYVITGTKCFISHFDAASVVIVFARTNPEVKPSRGISAFIWEKKPERQPPGVSHMRAMPKMGMRAVRTIELELDELRISKQNLIGEEGQGFPLAMQTLDRGRLSVGAQGVGTAQGAFSYALNYAKTRFQFGRPIGTFQAIQFKLADMAVEIEAARQILYLAADYADDRHPQLTLYAAMAKCLATDVAMKVTTEAVQILGGYGYMKDFPLERFMRDAKAMQIYEGTNEIQRLVIARHLLGRLE
jgi:alkylation response protein AidB-like acyl-CoA dehydrogenase